MAATSMPPLVSQLTNVDDRSTGASSSSRGSPETVAIEYNLTSDFPSYMMASFAGTGTSQDLTPLMTFRPRADSRSPTLNPRDYHLSNGDTLLDEMDPLPRDSIPISESNQVNSYQDYRNLAPMSSSLHLREEAHEDHTIMPEDVSPHCEPITNQCARCGQICYNQWWADGTDHLLCDRCKNLVITPPSTTSNVPNAAPVATVTAPPPKPKTRTQRRTSVKKNVNQSCANCETTNTTLWRRDAKANTVCNACGLYFKLHGYKRPLNMRKDSIQKRKRKPRSPEQRQRNSPASNSRSNGTRESPTSRSPAYGAQASPTQLLDLSGSASVQSLPPVHTLDGFPHQYTANGALSPTFITPIFNNTSYLVNYAIPSASSPPLPQTSQQNNHSYELLY